MQMTTQIDGETVETVVDFIFLGSKITADGDCSHELKRHLLLGRKVMTTGKTIALTRWTFVGKVMSLLFNMLSRLFMTFLPRSKHLLISWLTLFFWAPKSLQMVTAAMKLKDAYSLEGKLRPTQTAYWKAET